MPETNQHAWRGVRPISPEENFTYHEPPEGAAYSFSYVGAANDWVTLYTIPEGKRLYLTDIYVSFSTTDATSAEVQIRTAGGSTLASLAFFSVTGAAQHQFTHNFTIAWPIDETDFIRLRTWSDNATVKVWTMGYLKDA